MLISNISPIVYIILLIRLITVGVEPCRPCIFPDCHFLLDKNWWCGWNRSMCQLVFWVVIRRGSEGLFFRWSCSGCSIRCIACFILCSRSEGCRRRLLRWKLNGFWKLLFWIGVERREVFLVLGRLYPFCG